MLGLTSSWETARRRVVNGEMLFKKRNKGAKAKECKKIRPKSEDAPSRQTRFWHGSRAQDLTCWLGVVEEVLLFTNINTFHVRWRLARWGGMYARASMGLAKIAAISDVGAAHADPSNRAYILELRVPHINHGHCLVLGCSQPKSRRR